MIRIIEVGPRDGLQNEPTPIPTEIKRDFIVALAGAGLTEIEATSFVSPKWVPQLGDAAELWPQIASLADRGVRLSALVPNPKGLERAISCGCRAIAVFTAASDAFTQKNIGMSVAESLTVFAEVVGAFRASQPDGWVRGYVSTAFECPYAGRMAPANVAEVAERLLAMGVDEVSIGDTIGVAAPREVRILSSALLDAGPAGKYAFHFHDTRGTAIANVAEALNQGFTAFDASAAGLGGCPYAPGAGGNLATEDLVYFLGRSGVPTVDAIDLTSLAQASRPILDFLGRPPSARSQRAVLAETSPTQ